MPNRVHIACTKCKLRKVRCDGASPKCARCTVRGLDCVYAAERKYRGRGKKTLVASPPPTLPPSVVHAIPDEAITRVVDRIFPSFLLPGAFEANLQRVTANICTSEEADCLLAPPLLLPLEIARRLILNTFDDICITKLPFLCYDRTTFLALLDEHYLESAESPPFGNQPDRCALVNAVLAVAVVHKMASQGDAQIERIAAALFRNSKEAMTAKATSTSISNQATLVLNVFARTTGHVL